jgi:hypothetical protein
MQFYSDEVMVYYHIARAYKNGVESFGQLKDIITQRLVKRFSLKLVDDQILLFMLAANILLDYETEIILAEEILDAVTRSKLYPAAWESIEYFSSENRNFLAGSPEFTASVFIQAISKLERLKK